MSAPGGGIQMEVVESRKEQSGSVLGGASKHRGKKRKGKEGTQVLGKSSVSEDDAVVVIGRGKYDALGKPRWSPMKAEEIPPPPEHSQFPSELQSEMALQRLKGAGMRVVNLSEKCIISGLGPNRGRMHELRALCHTMKKAEHKLHLLLGCTEAGSPPMTEAGMEDSAKSSWEKLVIGQLPPETEVKGESMEQDMIEPTGNADLISTDTDSNFGYDDDFDEWPPTTFDSNKLLLEAADPVLSNTGYGNVDEMDKDKSAALPPETEVKGESVDQHMIEPTENADLIPTDTESDFGYDVDVDEWRPTTFDLNKLLLEAADPVPTNTGYGNVDEMDKDKSAEQLCMEAEEMAAEESDFARYAEIRDRRSAHDGYFGDMTTLSSTQFTHLLPGTKVYGAGFPSTLQVLSIKLTDIKGGLEWPFPVYGMVAV